MLPAGCCVWFVLEIIEDAASLIAWVSSGGWSRKSGAGGSGLGDCWRTGEERSLIRTSLSVGLNCVPREQVHPHPRLEGHRRNMDEVGPCC